MPTGDDPTSSTVAGGQPTIQPSKGEGGPPLTYEQIHELIDTQVRKPRFDASVLGWRAAPYGVLADAGLSEMGPTKSCDYSLADAKTETQLDFTPTYFPERLKVSLIEGPIKTLCGDEATSVRYVYEVYSELGYGEIWFERSTRTSRVLEMNVPFDSVETQVVRDTPAIVVHPDDDSTGFGSGRVVMIEDDLGEEFTILSIFADNGVPFDELIKIAEGIR